VAEQGRVAGTGRALGLSVRVLVDHVNGGRSHRIKPLQNAFMNKIYLGDSVYAEWEATFAGRRLKLTTNNGWPDDPRNVIYLEPEVWEALLLFVKPPESR